MMTITIEQISQLFTRINFKHQLRDDGKIVFLIATETFRDADGDSSIYFVLSIPFENVVRITAASLFSEEEIRSKSSLLKSLNTYNCNAVAGQFCLAKQAYWDSSLYTDGSLEQIEEHAYGSLDNLVKFLENHARESTQSDCYEDNGIPPGENLLVERLEQCLRLSGSEENLCAPLDPSISKSNSYKASSWGHVAISDNLSDDSKAYAEANIDKIIQYIEKSMLSLPSNHGLRIQHGNDSKCVIEGPNKGPYLVVIDENGKEKKSARVFLSRKGRLNSYIALSTILSRIG